MEHYGLMGYPLGHSMSPEIHQRLFSLEGVFADFQLFPIPPEDFDRQAVKVLELRGFNVTIPYKTRIIPLLDELHESAAFYHSVNTVLRRPDGSHIGYNTDCDGFLHTMDAHGISIGGRVCVLGAGGVGRMFVLECARQGADVTVAVRESGMEKASALAREVGGKTGGELKIADIAALKGPYDLLINGTPVGMYPNRNACPVAEDVAARCGAVFDCVYNPVETVLIGMAKKRGIPCAGGVDMLVWQAVAAHGYWNRARVPSDAVNAMIPVVAASISRMFP